MGGRPLTLALDVCQCIYPSAVYGGQCDQPGFAEQVVDVKPLAAEPPVRDIVAIRFSGAKEHSDRGESICMPKEVKTFLKDISKRHF